MEIIAEIYKEEVNNLNVPGLTKIISKFTHGEKLNLGEKTFKENNPTFIQWPLTFHWCGKEYTPDFYDPETQTIYEIIGTRQRYYQGQNKILSLIRNLPALKILACRPDGKLLPLRFKNGRRSFKIEGIRKIGANLFYGYNVSSVG